MINLMSSTLTTKSRWSSRKERQKKRINNILDCKTFIQQYTIIIFLNSKYYKIILFFVLKINCKLKEIVKILKSLEFACEKIKNIYFVFCMFSNSSDQFLKFSYIK